MRIAVCLLVASLHLIYFSVNVSYIYLLFHLLYPVVPSRITTSPNSIHISECIPLILGGGDVLASSETGSGKTAAFAIPILQLCHESKSAEIRHAAAPSASSRNQTKTSDKGNEGGDNGGNDKNSLKYEMSCSDRDKLISIDPSGCLVQCRDIKQWSGCRCTAGVTRHGNGNNSKFCYECEIMDEGIVRVGFATADASLNLGTDEFGYGYGGTGVKVHRNKFDSYTAANGETVSFTKGDVIGCMVDMGDEGGMSFCKNGQLVGKGKAFDLSVPGKKGEALCLYPAISLKNAQCKLNFCGPFRYPLMEEDGYRPIGAATSQTGGVRNPRSVMKSAGEKSEGPLAIVIEPTRDLAQQTYDTFAKLATRLPDPSIETTLLVGGVNSKKALDMLEKNSVDVLVATPPICAAYIKKGKIKTSRSNIFLLDEADNLVGNKDTIEDIMLIYSRLPKAAGHTQSVFSRLQVCFFSATLHSKEVKDLSAKICHRPLWVDLRGKNDSIIPDTVHHCVIYVNPASYDAIASKGINVQTDAVHRKGKLGAATDWSKLSSEETQSERIKLMKPHVLVDVLERFEMDSVLVFCRTNLDCDNLEYFLKNVSKDSMVNRDKFSCRVLAGMRTMQERRASLKAFKDGEVRILIATDVAARGIDIRELPFVVNMMLPDEAETYVHRIGRVGRAERIGLAINIVATGKEYVWWCQKGTKPPCSDTRLFSKGGNCKWYDEQKLLKQVESLLKTNKVSVTKLTAPDMNIPAEMAALIKGKGYGDYAGGDSVDPELNAHLNELSSIVNELSVTEFTLQSEYWKLKDRFSSFR